MLHEKIIIHIFLATFLFIDFIAYGQVWNEANGYNEIGRHHPITVANDNYGYMIAGQDATFSNNLDDVFRYDIALDQWTQLNLFLAAEEDMDMEFMMKMTHI